MAVNVGSVDRMIRLFLGLVLLVTPFVSGMAIFASGLITALSVLVGVVMIAVAATRVCPLYSVLGIKTCKS